ncbi:MAG: L-aspartate oxidase [Planctomycetota bacterium]|nr:L-aspartate oxidase [Planctomycetota bacterium]
MPAFTATADLHLDRYLVPFDPRRVPHYRFDVVVLGSGAAGSLAALTAANQGLAVALVTKAALGETNTRYAQGGMAAVLGMEDSFDAHVADTLEVGCGLSEPGVVRRVVEGGPLAVQCLLDLGTSFDRTEGGAFALSREGGHSHHRVVHSRGTATGEEIQLRVREAVLEHEGVSTFSEQFVLDLLSDEDDRVVGVLCRDGRDERVAFLASQVVLATGGAGQLYRETTNPAIATADGVAMAVRAGASVRDMEFVQFHPTCLYIAGAARVLISEVLRGAGGVLRDRYGHRFMQEHHPAAELAPRDVVSRAAFERMVATNDTSVYLDLSDLDRDPHRVFPGVSSICRFFGIDIAKDPIPVRPGCHYQVGGLWVDKEGRTTVQGLWAVGECSSTGLHGANRMGSNSLLEAIVCGQWVGKAAADAAREVPQRLIVPTSRREGPPAPPVQVNVADLTYSLKSLMWRQLGVERGGEGIADALDSLAFWRRAVGQLPLVDAAGWELANMLTTATLIALGAQARTESRGVHYRLDHREADDAWHRHLVQTPISSGVGVRALELRSEELFEQTIRS